MRFRTKLAILAVAVLLTFIGFNMIASSPAVEIMKVGKLAGNQIIANVLAKTEVTSSHSAFIN
jgi:hypothetical protein